jgi:hypothetical protein
LAFSFDLLDFSLIHPRYPPETYNHLVVTLNLPHYSNKVLLKQHHSTTAPQQQTQLKSHFIDNQQNPPPNPKMYSCANQPRGCRGRVNSQGAKCKDCSVRLSGDAAVYSGSGLTFFSDVQLSKAIIIHLCLLSTSQLSKIITA